MSWLQKIQGLLGMEGEKTTDYDQLVNVNKDSYINNTWTQEQLENYNKQLMSWPKNHPNNPLFNNQKELQYFKDPVNGDVIPYDEHQRRLRERAIQEGRLKPANKGLLQ